MSLLATFNRISRARKCFKAASLAMALATCVATANPSLAEGPLEISSPAFANDATIPAQYACTGADKSPPLKWSGVPAGTKALALMVEDPDAPGGTFIHWIAYDIPPSKPGLESGIAPGDAMPDGGKQGINGFNKVGYNGPCPPPGSPHHYHFRLFALDEAVNPQTPATASALEDAMKGHVKANAELIGIFRR